MKKQNYKKIDTKGYVRAEELRHTLIKIAQTYNEAPYQRAQKTWEELSEKLEPQRKQFEDMAKLINQQINSLGLPQIITKIQEQYVSILKDHQSSLEETFILPQSNVSSLSEEIIDRIAEKAAEKVVEKIKNSPDKNISNPPLIKLPQKTDWEDIEIRFKNGYDVEIYCKKEFLEKSNHEKMKFYRRGTKDKKPDVQWRFLQTLSTFCVDKKIIKPTISDIAYSLKVKKDNCMKIKEKLSEKLQENFGIDKDPFYNYKDRGYYQTIFKLTPEPMLRRSGEVWKTASGYEETPKKKYLDY